VISIHNSFAFVSLLPGFDHINMLLVFLFGLVSKIYQFFSIVSIILGLGNSKDPVIQKFHFFSKILFD
jgi:hypothetical protein